ncbi:MAG: hypothetical protein LBV75_00165 [Paludibacter sp.]|jgi:hypothetical protein|nr:hypothetical protein [Paludibacter sp.]
MKNLWKYIIIFAVGYYFSGCSNVEQQIEKSLSEQLEKYPESRLQDIYKNFYQDCFGTGHAISDTAMVLNYLQSELQNSTPAPSAPMIETLGWRHNFVRINIDAVRQGKISAENLAKAFIAGASKVDEKNTKNWVNEWQTITRIIEKKHLPVKDFETDKAKIDSILRANPTQALHHSAAFNQNYNPHYRVVEKSDVPEFEY